MHNDLFLEESQLFIEWETISMSNHSKVMNDYILTK